MRNSEKRKYRDIEYIFVRSSRKTCSIHISRDGCVEVRAPLFYTAGKADGVIESKYAWITRTLGKVRHTESEASGLGPLTADDIRKLAENAVKVIPERVAYYAKLAGVTYGRITIRNQVTRWGSCSASGNLNFNCLLMLTPPEVIDSVVVHELCHRKEMNHSAAFYSEVRRIFPEYDKWNKWLKKNGPVLLERMRAGLMCE